MAPALGALLLALGVVLVVEWVAGRVHRELLKGLGVGALVGLAAAKGLLETAGLAVPFLDGAWRAGAFFGAVPLVLGLLDGRVGRQWARGAIAAGLALLAGVAVAFAG